MDDWLGEDLYPNLDLHDDAEALFRRARLIMLVATIGVPVLFGVVGALAAVAMGDGRFAYGNAYLGIVALIGGSVAIRARDQPVRWSGIGAGTGFGCGFVGEAALVVVVVDLHSEVAMIAMMAAPVVAGVGIAMLSRYAERLVT